MQLNTTVQFCLHWACSRGSQINPNSMSFLSFLVGRSAFGKPYESLCTLIAIFLVLSLKTKTITSLCAGLLFASAMTWRSHGLGCNNGDEVPLWSDGNAWLPLVSPGFPCLDLAFSKRSEVVSFEFLASAYFSSCPNCRSRNKSCLACTPLPYL